LAASQTPVFLGVHRCDRFDGSQLAEWINALIAGKGHSLRVKSMSDPAFADGTAWLALLHALYDIEPRG
jgi:hypothetical protein